MPYSFTWQLPPCNSPDKPTYPLISHNPPHLCEVQASSKRKRESRWIDVVKDYTLKVTESKKKFSREMLQVAVHRNDNRLLPWENICEGRISSKKPDAPGKPMWKSIRWKADLQYDCVKERGQSSLSQASYSLSKLVTLHSCSARKQGERGVSASASSINSGFPSRSLL